MIIIDYVVCLIIGIVVGYYIKSKVVKKRKIPKNLNYDDLNFGTTRRTVNFSCHNRYSYSGEDKTETITAKIKFKGFLGNDKIKVEYLEVLNYDTTNTNILSVLNKKHDMVDYKDVNWITHNHNEDIVINKRDLFTMLNGGRMRKKGEVLKFESDLNTSDLLEFIANK